MPAHRPDPVVRLLNVILTFIYFAGWGLAGILVVLFLGAELLADPASLQNFVLGVPAAMRLDVGLQSSWGGTIALDRGRVSVDMSVPLSIAPAWFRAAAYVTTAILGGLALAFLHHLRQLFRRVRDGAPFDARNAARVRWLGVLLIAGELTWTALGSWQSWIILRTVGAAPMPLGPSFAPDGKMILIGLMLIALAEVFRRGTALEDEQSLVV